MEELRLKANTHPQKQKQSLFIGRRTKTTYDVSALAVQAYSTHAHRHRTYTLAGPSLEEVGETLPELGTKDVG